MAWAGKDHEAGLVIAELIASGAGIAF